MKKLESIKNSYELFKVINQHRVECGKAPIRNLYELHQKIKDEIGEDLHERKKTCMQIETSNKGYREFEAYELTREDVYLVSMRESKQVRKSVYRYLEELEQTLETVKDIAWEAIEGRNYIGQSLGLKLAGIKHPTLLIRYGQEYTNARKELFESNRIVCKTINRHGDTQWRITQDGFEWLCMNRERCNDFVERVKNARKPL